MALTIKLPFILERETSTHYKCEAFQTGCGKINSVASSAVFHLVTKPTLKIWQPTTSDRIKALIQTYCTKAQKFHHTSVTMLCPPPTKKITQSACISCSAPTANPFRIQSYNLEGLSADLPVQATNGWAKGLHWCALCPALPPVRTVKTGFFVLSDTFFYVRYAAWSHRGVREENQIQGWRHKLPRSDSGDGQRASGRGLDLDPVRASHGSTARHGTVGLLALHETLLTGTQGRWNGGETGCMYAPTHLYLFNDVQWS